MILFDKVKNFFKTRKTLEEGYYELLDQYTNLSLEHSASEAGAALVWEEYEKYKANSRALIKMFLMKIGGNIDFVTEDLDIVEPFDFNIEVDGKKGKIYLIKAEDNKTDDK